MEYNPMLDKILLFSKGKLQKQAQMCAEGCEGVFHCSLILIKEKVFSNKESLVWQNRSPGQCGVRLVDQEDRIKFLGDKMLSQYKMFSQ